MNNLNLFTSHNDNSLAPRSWDSYIGQEKAKERLRIAIDAAIERFEPLKHVLILGPAGFGKTSLAEIVAKESKTELMSLTMTPNYDMKKLFNRLKDFDGGTVFLDEIHCLSKKDQHFLLDLLEKKKLSYPNGKVEYLSIPLTIIAATTEPDLLIKPLYDRFPYRITLQPYSELEMAKIVERMSLQLDMHPTKDACIALGRASAGVPRQARTLVFTAQDIGSLEAIDDILETCGITREGLTEDHIAYLRSLFELGNKAGKANIALHSGRPEKIVLDLEKLLVLRNYVTITPSGRELTYEGMKVLKEALS